MKAGRLASRRASVIPWLLWLGIGFGITCRGGEPPAEPPNPLVWDALSKSLVVQSGDGAVDFEFGVKNTAAKPIEIIQVRPSCGCTVAEIPRSPWILAPGEKGSFTGTMDVRGKTGQFSKTIFVNSTAGTQMLRLDVTVEATPEKTRAENRQMASADRQAVFRGDCARCHVAPIGVTLGGVLFQNACAICHLANPRASMVPDLLTAREHRDEAWWRKWISEGKEGSLMPAFAKSKGGPLTEAQIDSLVEYAVTHLPTEPRREP